MYLSDTRSGSFPGFIRRYGFLSQCTYLGEMHLRKQTAIALAARPTCDSSAFLLVQYNAESVSLQVSRNPYVF